MYYYYYVKNYYNHIFLILHISSLETYIAIACNVVLIFDNTTPFYFYGVVSNSVVLDCQRLSFVTYVDLYF